MLRDWMNAQADALAGSLLDKHYLGLLMLEISASHPITKALTEEYP